MKLESFTGSNPPTCCPLPVPYYDRDGITIYNHDSLEVLSSLKTRVAAIITDPPYCSGATEAAKRGKREAMTPESVNARPTIELDAMVSLGFASMPLPPARLPSSPQCSCLITSTSASISRPPSKAPQN
jgi:hypothetical protein